MCTLQCNVRVCAHVHAALSTLSSDYEFELYNHNVYTIHLVMFSKNTSLHFTKKNYSVSPFLRRGSCLSLHSLNIAGNTVHCLTKVQPHLHNTQIQYVLEICGIMKSLNRLKTVHLLHIDCTQELCWYSVSLHLVKKPHTKETCHSEQAEVYFVPAVSTFILHISASTSHTRRTSISYCTYETVERWDRTGGISHWR